MDKLFLLDAYALIYRSYYAFIKNPRIIEKFYKLKSYYKYSGEKRFGKEEIFPENS